ncbi:MAG: MFS transporter, partial [Spirochaeta sp.]|nr:MFS transporter [Spirochaeta sp.]
MTKIDKALFTNNTAMLLYGLSAVLIGPTLPGMISSFDLTLGQAGFIGAMQNVGGIAGALLALLIADRVSHTKSAVVSFILLGIALFAVGISHRYGIVLVTFAATGLFIRIMDVMLNAGTGDFAVARAVESERAEAVRPGQAVPTNRSGRDLSTLHMFFSIGAFAGPVAARAIMGAGMSWSQVFRWTGVAYLVVAVLAMPWLRRYGRITTQEPDRSADLSADLSAGPAADSQGGAATPGTALPPPPAAPPPAAARLAVPVMG